MKARGWLLFGALAMGSFEQQAAAQPGGPHGYVEPCTVGNHQEMYTECESCPARPADPRSCNEQLGKRGYDQKCRTRGDASGWEEVWCIAKPAPAVAPPSAPPSAQPPVDSASAPPVDAPPSSNLPVLLAAAGVLAVLGAILFALRSKR